MTSVEPGDFVVLNWRAVCGECRSCRRGRSWYCFDTRNATQQMTLADGSPLSPALGIGAFAEKTLVADGQCTKVDARARPEAVGLLGCGIMADLYLQGRLDLDRFVSETIDLDDVEEAFHRMEARRGTALGGRPVTIEQVTTTGLFSLDGGDFEVENNIWIVGDDSQVVVIDAAHDHGPSSKRSVAGRPPPSLPPTATTTTSMPPALWPTP